MLVSGLLVLHHLVPRYPCPLLLHSVEVDWDDVDVFLVVLLLDDEVLYLLNQYPLLYRYL